MPKPIDATHFKNDGTITSLTLAPPNSCWCIHRIGKEKIKFRVVAWGLVSMPPDKEGEEGRQLILPFIDYFGRVLHLSFEKSYLGFEWPE